jgi:hypothetical protein
MTKSPGHMKLLAAGLGVLCVAVGCERTTESDRARQPEHATVVNAREPQAVVREIQPSPSQAREAERPAAAGGANTLAFGDALNDIAATRCERENRCGNVGQGKRYESVQTCRTVVRNDFARDLNAADCPAGIDRGELSECVQAVREESCGNPIEAIGRITACRTSDMCQATRTVTLR